MCYCPPLSKSQITWQFLFPSLFPYVIPGFLRVHSIVHLIFNATVISIRFSILEIPRFFSMASVPADKK